MNIRDGVCRLSKEFLNMHLFMSKFGSSALNYSGREMSQRIETILNDDKIRRCNTPLLIELFRKIQFRLIHV